MRYPGIPETRETMPGVKNNPMITTGDTARIIPAISNFCLILPDTPDLFFTRSILPQTIEIMLVIEIKIINIHTFI